MLQYRTKNKPYDNNNIHLIEHFKSFNVSNLIDKIGEGKSGNIYRIKINNYPCVLKLYKIIILKSIKNVDPVFLLPEIEVNIPMSDELFLTNSSTTKTVDTSVATSKSDSESKIEMDTQIYTDTNGELIDPNKDIYNSILKEIIILNKIKYVIDNNICPNFVYFYYSNILLQKLLIDGKISYEIDSINIYKLNLVNLYTVMEYCDGTLIDFFNEEYDIDIYKSFVFQICCAILCLQKHIGIKHNDISATNIMFIKINENTVLNYKINNINYFIPTYGFLFVIIDFDKSQFITKENNKLNSEKQF